MELPGNIEKARQWDERGSELWRDGVERSQRLSYAEPAAQMFARAKQYWRDAEALRQSDVETYVLCECGRVNYKTEARCVCGQKVSQ